MRTLKKGKSNKQVQFMCKKRDPIQEGSSVLRFMLEGSSGSHGVKPTCVTCRKRHYGECPVGTGYCFNCVKEGHKRRDCPIFETRIKEGQAISS